MIWISLPRDYRALENDVPRLILVCSHEILAQLRTGPNVLVRLSGGPGTAMPESDGVPAPRLAAQHNEVAMAKKTAKKKTKTKAKRKKK
jgi:hypothetical protein